MAGYSYRSPYLVEFVTIFLVISAATGQWTARLLENPPYYLFMVLAVLENQCFSNMLVP
jgi:hypothetical protein